MMPSANYMVTNSDSEDVVRITDDLVMLIEGIDYIPKISVWSG